MKTALDVHDYQSWYLDNLQYQDRLLTLTISASDRVTKNGDCNKTYLVVFSDTIQFQVYDEVEHLKDYHLNREDGVIGKYSSSSLLDYLKNETLLFATTPGELMHFSVMTGNEFIHVLTRREPSVVDVT